MRSPAASPSAGPRARPGGRSARVREAVLDAAYADLLESGYDALSIARVAAAAGVHETSIYRRWGTKQALVLDACSARAARVVPTPDTGSLRGDLLKLAFHVAALLKSREGAALGALILATQGQSAEQAAAIQFWAHRFRLAQVIFERAETRGEIQPGLDTHLVLEMLVGPLYFRVFAANEPLPASFLRRLVDTLVDGLSLGPARN